MLKITIFKTSETKPGDMDSLVALKEVSVNVALLLGGAWVWTSRGVWEGIAFLAITGLIALILKTHDRNSMIEYIKRSR